MATNSNSDQEIIRTWRYSRQDGWIYTGTNGYRFRAAQTLRKGEVMIPQDLTPDQLPAEVEAQLRAQSLEYELPNYPPAQRPVQTSKPQKYKQRRLI